MDLQYNYWEFSKNLWLLNLLWNYYHSCKMANNNLYKFTVGGDEVLLTEKTSVFKRKVSEFVEKIISPSQSGILCTLMINWKCSFRKILGTRDQKHYRYYEVLLRNIRVVNVLWWTQSYFQKLIS
jgi:hypothetical protein